MSGYTLPPCACPSDRCFGAANNIRCKNQDKARMRPNELPSSAREWVDQRVMHDPPHSQGDCMAACVASVLGLPPEVVPNIAAICGDDDSKAWDYFGGWLRERGCGFMVFNAPKDWRFTTMPTGLVCIAGGASPRGAAQGHAVVWEIDKTGGRMLHDPHPSRAGLVGSPTEFYVLLPLDLGTTAPPFNARPETVQPKEPSADGRPESVAAPLVVGGGGAASPPAGGPPVWLIKRGPNEGQVPHVWLTGGENWTQNPRMALGFHTKEAAQAYVATTYLAQRGPIYSITEHSFIDAPGASPEAAARAEPVAPFKPHWPAGLEPLNHYKVLCDDKGRNGGSWLAVMVANDGDVHVSMQDWEQVPEGEPDPFPSIRIRTFAGGGRHDKTRQALLWLAEAIRQDNAGHSGPTPKDDDK